MCLLVLSITTQAQTLKSLFNKYSNDERFEYVSVGRGMLTMGKIFGDTDEEKQPVLSKIKSLKILTLTDGFDDTLQKEVLKELDEVINTGNFETLLEVRDKTERVNIYIQSTASNDTDMLVANKDDYELSIIWIKGNLTPEELMLLLDD